MSQLPLLRASFFRRLAAMIYDSLLILAVLMLATAFVLPLARNDAISTHNLLYKIYLISITFCFYAGFWIYRGQTLGMMAWRIRIQRQDGGKLRIRDAVLRFVWAVPSLAFCGVGLFWVLWDRDRLALHDRWSKTELVRVLL